MYNLNSEPFKLERDVDTIVVLSEQSMNLSAGTVDYITQSQGEESMTLSELEEKKSTYNINTVQCETVFNPLSLWNRTMMSKTARLKTGKL